MSMTLLVNRSFTNLMKERENHALLELSLFDRW